MKEDGSHPTNVLSVLVILRVKVTEMSHSLPLMAGYIFISLINKHFLCLSTENKGGEKRERGGSVCVLRGSGSVCVLRGSGSVCVLRGSGSVCVLRGSGSVCVLGESGSVCVLCVCEL